MIISEEFSNWQDSGHRIDSLGLDATGRLVVVELKRGDTGQHMDLQAIRYAAMVANLTFQQVVDIFQAYLRKRARNDGNDIDEDDAESRIREQLGNTEGDITADSYRNPSDHPGFRGLWQGTYYLCNVAERFLAEERRPRNKIYQTTTVPEWQ